MSSTLNVPVALTSQLLTQNVTIMIGTAEQVGFGDLNPHYATSTTEVKIINSKLLMSHWKFTCKILHQGDMTITSELLGVVKNSGLKVLLHGVLLQSNGIESNIQSAKEGVIKRKDILSLVLGNGSIVDWREYQRDSLTREFFGKVTVRLNLTIEYLDQSIPNKDAVMKTFSESSLLDFSVAMKELLASPTFTNAKIVCADGVEIAVNKEILASRSPVFEAMFRTDMLEAATGAVQANDICGKSMKVFVEYLTTGKLNECWNEADVVTHLAIAADKYGIESLRVFMDNWLGEENLVRSNLELLNMAADCGYQLAEGKIAVNVGRRAKKAQTRDQVLAAIGMKRLPFEKATKKRAEKQLMNWMNNQLGERLNTGEICLDLVNLAADEGLDVAETKLVKELGERLEPAKSRDEVLEVLGLQQNRKTIPGQ